MLRRTITLLALGSLLVPLRGLADDREWEEDYNDGAGQEQRSDDYQVSVDVDAGASVSPDTFEGALAPYGDWVVAGSYGRVWRPHVAAGWRPYYYGRWEWTNEGWLWASDEPFGWAAYHYGRWTYDPYYSWLWIPGSEWAPAWVAWRYSGDVVGWAPLGPGVSAYVSAYPFVAAWWTFVPCQSFVSVPVYDVAFAPGHTRRYFDATAPAPPRPGVRPMPGRPVGAPAWGGPSPRAIEQRMGRPLTPVRVVAAPAPGASRVAPGEVSIFRPGARPGAGPGRPGAATGVAPGPSGRGESGHATPRGWTGPQQGTGPGAAPSSGPARPDQGRFTPRGSPGPQQGTMPGRAAPERAPSNGPARRDDQGRLSPYDRNGQQGPASGGAGPSSPFARPSLQGQVAQRGWGGWQTGGGARAQQEGRSGQAAGPAQPARASRSRSDEVARGDGAPREARAARPSGGGGRGEQRATPRRSERPRS